MNDSSIHKMTPLIIKIWKLLRELGGISLLFTVATFWVIQYNTYAQIRNTIRIDTSTNIILLGKGILADKNRDWAYLNTLFNNTYNNNWNYIAQYYSPECFYIIRSVAIDVESLNTLILQRQINNMTLNRDTLYQIAEELNPNLEKIMSCPIKPWYMGLVNKLY